METFSPELRLLLALIRTALGTNATPPAPMEPIDWSAFCALLERHRVGAFLYRRAATHLAAVCPGFVVQCMREISTAVGQRSLGQAAEQIRLMKGLEAAGVEVKAVKGLVLAQRLYGGLGTRHVGDIDLLIRPADVERADTALRAAGLHRSRPDIPLTPLQLRKFVQLKHEFEYRRAARPAPMRVELLWRLEGLPERAAHWSDDVTCTIGGCAMRTLRPDLDALYLLQHGARHGWFRLFWLVDAALLLRAESIGWHAVMERARQFRLERPLLQAAALAEELLGVPRPLAMAPRPGERRIVAALCAEAHRQIAREPAEHEGLGEWARQLSYRVRLQKGLRRKLAVLAPHLLTPESWRTWPLPDRWFFVYYFATPFLWLWRRVRRAG